MYRRLLLLGSLAVSSTLVLAGELPWPPQGRAVRAGVTRDTWVSSCQGETRGNLGGEARLKTKAYQEFSLVDLDPLPLRGFVVTGATLHLHCASQDVQRRLAVSSLASEWVEGTSSGYRPQPGASCFLEAETGRRPWAYPGSDITAAMFGEGNTIWTTWDASPPDREGWQVVAVDPRVVAARIAGISHGFAVFDDTGSEWTRNGESFRMRIFPNRFVHSRESGEATAPYFTVYLGAEDKEPPGAPSEIKVEFAHLPSGEALISWVTPADRGPAGTLGFQVRRGGVALFAWEEAKEVPRYLIPMAKAPGERVTMHLRDVGLFPGARTEVGIRAVDGAGNVGPHAQFTVRLPETTVEIELGGQPAPRFAEAAPLPRIGGAEVFVIDPLDAVHPVTGAVIPAQPPEYLAANHLWSAKDKLVRLHAARNEFVAFQIGLKGAVADAAPSLKLPAGVKGELLEFRYVGSKAGPLPDPLVPLKGSVSIPSRNLPRVSNPREGNGGQKVASLLADLYVPHDAQPGKHTGTLEITVGGETLSIAIELNVWDFTLPDFLSFVPEMNSYGLPAPPAERGYYRVAHAHRTCINRLPYSQSGSVAYAPRWDGQRLDWTEWDRHFGPYLDGSAFADLPRANVPVDTFYLPLHENWPASIYENYNGSYWADRAFPPPYRETFVRVARLFAEHFAERGWTNTFLEFYLNNKNNFKERGWSRGSSPWILDEPASFQDFWALRWFAMAFHEAIAPVRGATPTGGAGILPATQDAGGTPAPHCRLGFRIDISRPEWQRDSLNGLEDMVVCSGAFRHYRRMILDRQRRFGTVVFEYGSSNRIGTPNVQPAGWCVSAWCLGADGVLPWQTIGNDGSWHEADELSLFYPGAQVGSPEPVPSIRLKAYRRGQQDVEYLTLLTQVLKAPRWAVGEAVQRELHLVGTAKKGPDVAGIEDAGIVTFDRLSPASLWELRTRVGAVLSKAKPEPKQRLVDFRTPTRDVSKLPSFLPSPRPPSAEEKATAAQADAGKAIAIQGRPAVADALIAFDKPDQNFGSAARDNALRRAEQSNAFLVKFDLGKIPAGAQVASAKLSFFVWDPSSQGNSHVCAFRVTSMDWDEGKATWKQAATGTPWKGQSGFAVGADTLKEPDGDVVVPPDQGTDTVDPPLEYSIDVTKSVEAWLAGKAPNRGFALIAIADRAVDDGQWTRTQILGSEYAQTQFTPKLTVQLRK